MSDRAVLVLIVVTVTWVYFTCVELPDRLPARVWAPLAIAGAVALGYFVQRLVK